MAQAIECVCLCADIDEGYQFSTTDIVTARKQHECCECGEPIEPGKQYERVKGMYDGFWDVWKTCIPCRDIRSAYCQSWYFGMLCETLEECLGFNYVTGEWSDWAIEMEEHPELYGR